MHESEIDGRAINVDFNAPRPQGGFNSTPGSGGGGDRSARYGDSTPSAESSTLFVANISFDANSDILREEFSKHADVLNARLPTDRETGALKGFGYVDFPNVEEAKKAFTAMRGGKILGRSIRLDYSAPRDRPINGDNGSPGFRGGRGGRGGGRGGFDRGGRGGRGGGRGRGDSTNRGGFGDFKGKKMTF